MRKIDYLVIHCTASSENASILGIKEYWRNSLKWQNYGYHFIINRDGSHENITKIENIANGVKNFNHNSIHLSYIGGITTNGVPTDNRTLAQKDKLIYLLRDLKRRFPTAIIQGHRDFPKVGKACPCFDAKKEYQNLFDFI